MRKRGTDGRNTGGKCTDHTGDFKWKERTKTGCCGAELRSCPLSGRKGTESGGRRTDGGRNHRQRGSQKETGRIHSGIERLETGSTGGTGMKTILDEIAEKTRERIAKKKREIPTGRLLERIESRKEQKELFLFQKSLSREGLSFICEVKKASPSKGVIAETFPYLDIAKDYEKAGAAAISCLTEPFYFQGSDAYLEAIAREVQIPVLRKDFTVDPYMIYEAKAMGADAVLLICAILTEEELRSDLELAEHLGLSALVETHS